MMNYQAIFFDLDDTLYDLRSYWRGRLSEALEDVLARYPHFVRDELIQQAIAEKVYIEKLPAFLRARGIEDEPLIAQAHALFRREWFERLQITRMTPLRLITRQYSQRGLTDACTFIALS